MSASWESLHAALLESAKTLQAARQFRVARTAEPVLARFDNAIELIEYLKSDRRRDQGVLDDIDQIYAALVRGVQAGAEWAEVANTILGCGLWPGLNRAYKNRSRVLRGECKELAEAFATELIFLAGRVDLASVRRVAATLTRSTVREVMDARRRERLELAFQTGQQSLAMSALSHADADPERWPDGTRTRNARLALGFARAAVDPRSQDTDVGLPIGRSFEGELAALRARLLPVLGADTDLLLGVLVLDENQREAADRLGIAHDSARKRFRRALPRVRRYLLHYFPLRRS